MLDKTSPSASSLDNNNNLVLSNNKRKRKAAGTPDPDAEVVSLSPRTLLESDRYVCEICNQGFQRDQNLQMHRRRHKVPWKLLKNNSKDQVMRKKVYVCPEPSCLHHDPSHALGDLVGIKKHFRRKHSNHRQWVCDKCSKAYAVQSDYKAHLKTCGTRGHSCDCGRVFSRVESFIEHQDACNVRKVQPHGLQRPLQHAAACSSATASSTSASSDHANFNKPNPSPSTGVLSVPKLVPTDAMLLYASTSRQHEAQNLELQLLPSSPRTRDDLRLSQAQDHDRCPTSLKLSIGSSNSSISDPHHGEQRGAAEKVKEEAKEQLRIAMAEKKYAEEARQQAKRELEMAEVEFGNAQRIRQQAQAELEKALALREEATKKMMCGSSLMQVTCQACKQQFQVPAAALAADHDQTSLAISYISTSPTTEGEGEYTNDL